MKTKITKINETGFCGGCGHSRRSFLAGCAKIGAAGALSGLVLPTMLTAEGCTPRRSMKVRVVFATRGPVTEEADWPNIAFDFNPVMEKYMNALTSGCPKIEFVQSMAANAEQEKKLVEEDNARGDIDGYLLVHLVCSVRLIDHMIGTGKPFLYVDFLYAGGAGFLESGARMLRNNVENYAHMPSSNLTYVVAAANCFPLAKGPGGVRAFVDAVTKIRLDIAAGVNIDMSCIDDKFDILSTEDLLKELKTKKILAFERGYDLIQATKDSLGIEIIRRPFTELNALWEKADRDQAMEIVKRWKNNAEAIVGVRDMTLEKSARMYLAMKQCLKNHDACAITINCLGGFYDGSIQAYPCLGFHELLNEGLIGACECDLFSAVTMVVMTTLTKGRPGFISDPVLDIPGKEIIYAHCVASNKPFGPQGASNPFTIMTHSEDRQGASVRSTLPEGYMTTSLQMWPGTPRTYEIVIHQAKSVGNSTDDRACRTKLVAAPVGDYEKLFTEWDRWGWHRVTYYGDLKEPVFALAGALGWKIIEEA